MAVDAGVRRPGRGGRRIASAIIYPSMLLAATFLGCSPAQILRWPSSTTDPRGPQPAPSPVDMATAPHSAVRPGPYGAAEPPKITAAVGNRANPADQGVEKAAVEAPAAATTADVATVIPPAASYPIDLSTALRLAEVENPLIAEARQRIGEALALQQKANVLLVPDLNVGANFHNHTGNLQRSSGRILRLDEKSFYVGGGSEVYAASPAEVPAVNISSQLTDAIFEPLAARQNVERSRFTASATANRILLEVAELHFELLAAEADLRVRRLSAEQEAEVAKLTRSYADAQQGQAADAQRAETELRLIEREIRQAEEGVAVNSARLARRLHLDQNVRLQPLTPEVELVTIVDPGAPLPDLIGAALRRRPEIGATTAEVGVAETRTQQERYRPLLPTIWIGFSGGAFGGGSNLVGTPLGGFAGRTDFDVVAYWTLRNLGMGNVSLVKQRRAQVGQAVAARSRAIAQVRSEVGEAYARVLAARQRVALADQRLASAEIGFREDMERIRNTVGRPIEVVNSLRLLNEARVARIRAVTDYNQAEFRLFVALGSPPPLSGPSGAAIPPAPIASPPLPPLATGGAGAEESPRVPIPRPPLPAVAAATR